MEYGISKTVQLPFESAVRKVTEELKTEGFGVLTTIDVKDTLARRLGVEFRNYVILGACNPPLAHRALTVDENIGLFLPCNVIVYESNGDTVVSAFDPMSAFPLLGRHEFEEIAAEVRERLARVIERM